MAMDERGTTNIATAEADSTQQQQRGTHAMFSGLGNVTSWEVRRAGGKGLNARIKAIEAAELGKSGGRFRVD